MFEEKQRRQTLILTNEITDTSKTVDIFFFSFVHLIVEFRGHVVDLGLLGRERFENSVAISDSGDFDLTPSLTVDQETSSVRHTGEDDKSRRSGEADDTYYSH